MQVNSQFKKFIDEHIYKAYYSYEIFLNKDERFFKSLTDYDFANESYLNYIVSKVKRYGELLALRNNNFLFEQVLKKYVLIGQNTQFIESILDKYNLNLFLFCSIGYSQNAYMLKLIEANQYMYKHIRILKFFQLNAHEKSSLVELLNTNEAASNAMNYIIENQLTSTFQSFDELMHHLKKAEKKLNLNI